MRDGIDFPLFGRFPRNRCHKHRTHVRKHFGRSSKKLYYSTDSFLSGRPLAAIGRLIRRRQWITVTVVTVINQELHKHGISRTRDRETETERQRGSWWRNARSWWQLHNILHGV